MAERAAAQTKAGVASSPITHGIPRRAGIERTVDGGADRRPAFAKDSAPGLASPRSVTDLASIAIRPDPPGIREAGTSEPPPRSGQLQSHHGWLESRIGQLPADLSIAEGKEWPRTVGSGTVAAARGSKIVGESDAFRGTRGQFVLAHEVAHVLQQHAVGLPGGTETTIEADADRFANAVMAGTRPAVRYAAPVSWAYKKKRPKPIRPGDVVRRIVVGRADRSVVVHMRSGNEHSYTWSTNSVPAGKHVGQNVGGAIQVKGQKTNEFVLYFSGAPDPKDLVFPGTFPLQVVGKAGSAEPAGAGGGGVAAGPTDEGVDGATDAPKAPGTGGGANASSADTSGGGIPEGDAAGPDSEPQASPDAKVPVIQLTDLRQLDELKKRGLLNAASADQIKASLERGESLSFEQAIELLDGLDKLATPGETPTTDGRDSWLKWAKFAKENMDKLTGKSTVASGGLTVDEVKEIIARHKEYVGVEKSGDGEADAAAEEKDYDPAKRKGWNKLSAQDRKLIADYTKKYGRLPAGDPDGEYSFGDAERFSFALRISPNYVKGGGREALKALVNDPIFVGGTMLSIAVYLAAWMAPEPIFSKGFAATVTVALLTLFTASEILNLARAWMRLDAEAGEARTLSEIEEAAENFGKALGGVLARVLVTLATIFAGKALGTLKPPAGGAGPPGQLAPAGAGGVGPPGAVPAPAAAAPATAAVANGIKVLADGTVVVLGTSAMASIAGGAKGGASGGKAPSSKGGTTQGRKAKLTPEEERAKQILEEFAEQQGRFRSDAKAEAATEPGMKTTKSPGKSVPARLDRGQLAHKYAEFLIPESQLPKGLKAELTVELPGGKIRLDRVAMKEGVYYEIKPNTPGSKAAGEAQILKYAEYLNREYPLGGGRKWVGKVVTYEHADAIGMFGL